MNAGSLFSGVGGLDLGLARAGFRHSFLCEKRPFRRDILSHRFPGIPVFDDVTTLETGDLPDIDLLCGGFPCTDLSVAGQRAGLEGNASGLFYEFARIASDLRPRWLLLENVPGLFSSNGGRDFGAVLGEMVDLGYGVAWRTLDSRFFGVPQRRQRVFILGALIDGDSRAAAERAGEVLGVGTRCPRHPRTRSEEREADPGDAEGSAGEDSYFVEGAPNATLRANGAGGARTDKQPMVVSTLQGGDSGGMRMDADSIEQLVSETVTSKWSKGSGGPSGDETQNLVASFSENQRGELRESAISPPVQAEVRKTGQGSATVRQDTRVRKLMPLECERLQGFPDDWTAPTGSEADTNRYAAIGDAVTVNVGEWIGRRLMMSS